MAASKTLYASNRCIDAGWSYELFAPLPGLPSPQQVSAWDGTRWFVPGYAPRDPPPYLVHVDIEASIGSQPVVLQGLTPHRMPRVTDAMLNASRAPAAVSFGVVRWYGRRGELILLNGNAGGEQAGHLVFYFHTGSVNYDVSLHAWASILRISDRGITRLVSAPESGPALPHVIATLKAIIGPAVEH